VLPISLEDCAAYEQLPFPNPQHRDPFDRMILTHALRNGLAVVGTDLAFDSYPITRLW
jgi:PIN domain nuclease of toxin-antitoxin system